MPESLVRQYSLAESWRRGGTMKRYAACALLSLSLGTIAWAADERERAAAELAAAYLTLFDEGKYGDAWEALAKELQAATETKENFERTMASMAKKTGPVTSRSVKSVTDDGTSIVIEFAVLTNKAATTTETLTLAQQPDGVWKVTAHTLAQRARGVTLRR